MKTNHLLTILALFTLTLTPLSSHANSWTPFIENLEVGKTHTTTCDLLRGGWDDTHEFYYLIVHSDSSETYALRGRAKPGVVTDNMLRNAGPLKVTAKLLSRAHHTEKRLVNIELEILTVQKN